MNDWKRRLAVTALLLAAVTSARAADRTRLVKVSIFTTGGVRAFRHQISVTNKDRSRHVVSVLVGQFPGLFEEPESVSAPEGWRSQVLRRDTRDGMLWSVRFSCGAMDSTNAMPATTTTDSGCGLRAGESVKFALILAYESASIEPVFVDFSDGRTGIASR